jgi:membrane protease YdiL (CAAX protease family)
VSEDNNINTIGLFRPRWLKKSGVFLLFFLVETMVFAIITLSPYLSKTALLGFRSGLTAALLVIAWFLRRSERGKSYWPVFYAFFVAGAAVLISGLFSNDLLSLFGQTITTPQGIAVAKFSESILRVLPILVLMPIVGFDWRSMYLKTGKVRLWLPIAMAALIVFPALAYFPLNSSQAGLLDKLLPLWPWILLFVLSNGFMEELLYRGLFLQKYEPFLGKGLSNILTAIVFALMHTQVTYAAQMIQFLVIVLVLSLIWGILIQKTDSLWGAVLFHAAGDCLIIFGAYASM